MTTEYNFDPSGTLQSNRIVGEEHNITSVGSQEYIVVIPKKTPFFPDDGEGRFVLTRVAQDGSADVELIEGIDFIYTHKFEAYSNQYPSESVYGSLILLDTSFNGTVSIDYQTLGGKYTLDEQQVMELLASTLTDPRTTTWDSLVDIPVLYDPITHTHSSGSFIGYGDMVDMLRQIRDQLSTAYNSFKDLISSHVKQSDPHKFINLSTPTTLVESNKYYEMKQALHRGQRQSASSVVFDEPLVLQAGDIVSFDMQFNNADEREDLVLLNSQGIEDNPMMADFGLMVSYIDGQMKLLMRGVANTYYNLDGDATDENIGLPIDGVKHRYAVEVSSDTQLVNIAHNTAGYGVVNAPITNIKVVRGSETIFNLRNEGDYIAHVLPLVSFFTEPQTVTVKTGGLPATAIQVNGLDEETMSVGNVDGVTELLLDEAAIVYFTFNPTKQVWEVISQ